MGDFETMWFLFLSLPGEVVIQFQLIAGRCATARKHLGAADWIGGIVT